MKEFWDSRYAEKEFVYGKEPNLYFKHQIDKLKAGKILLPAEGEGRNAVYAAKCGWNVDAVDQSETGKEKALNLALVNQVKIQYDVADLQIYSFPENEFDAIALIFAHFPPELRKYIHKKITKSLKTNGVLILEAFSKNQIKHESGGPKNIEMLYSLDEMLADFKGFEILESTEQEVELNEGIYHKGIAEIIRFLAIKQS